MALHAVCFLLLLFSMLPLFDATDCRNGLYCPAGLDCNNNNTLCEAGNKNSTEAKERIEECNKGINAFFTRSHFEVRENNGPVEPVIRLSEAIECCSISLKILIKDVTTTKNKDYVAPRGDYVEAIVPGGLATASFSIGLINDEIIEGNEYFEITVVTESLPHGYTWEGNETVRVYILDDDDGCVDLGRTTSYSVSENRDFLEARMFLTKAAAFVVNVTIDPTPFTARGCDFKDENHVATFKAGTKMTTFKLNITDDDIFEGPELFNFAIVSTSHSQVRRCPSRFRGSVTITDDEKEINVRFDTSSYMVVEGDDETISPLLKLDRPSPCCITVVAVLMNGTATGGAIDFGYSPPERYEYVFPAGETCAEPDKPIPIIDDRTSEVDERFSIKIAPYSVPLGVRASTAAPSITIKDADIECCFENRRFEVNEGEELKLRLKLDKTATGNFNLQVYPTDGTAISGIDYYPGPYNVTIKRFSRNSDVFSIGIMRNHYYTGDKYFTLMINDSKLPVPLVACEDNSENITIIDKEYTVCFDKRNVTVLEGDRVNLVVSTSKQLSRAAAVNYVYSNGTGIAATPSPPSRGSDYTPVRSSFVTNTRAVTISTVRDNILEFVETFAIAIPFDLIHNTPAAADCITKVDVDIIDGPGSVAVNFEEILYRPLRDKNEIIKPVIQLSRPIGFAIQVTLRVENGTAKSGEDYVVQETHPAIVINPNKLKGDLAITTIDDDVVELLIEEFYADIRFVELAYGGTVDRIYVGDKNRTTIQIKDDDACTVMLVDSGVKFSKPIFSNVSIEIDHTQGPTFFDWVEAKKISYTFNAAVGKIIKITVCIPKALYVERPRRVTSGDSKVVICSY